MKPSDRIKNSIELEESYADNSPTALIRAKFLSDTGYSDPKLADIVYILDEFDARLRALEANPPHHE